jgi:uroporphyrinogen-III synthase
MSKIYLTSPKSFKETQFLPMIEFITLAKKIDFNEIDTLLFTSKQAVAVTDSIDKRWKQFDSIAIGPATKKEILQRKGRVIFQPKEYYGKSLAKDILKIFQNRKILYLRPKKIIFDTKNFLTSQGVFLKEQIIYETKCKTYSKTSKPPRDSIIVFTSPSTIECFLKNFGWDETYKAVVIGKSTQKHLPKEANFKVANTPSISACIQKAKEWL